MLLRRITAETLSRRVVSAASHTGAGAGANTPVIGQPGGTVLRSANSLGDRQCVERAREGFAQLCAESISELTGNLSVAASNFVLLTKQPDCQLVDTETNELAFLVCTQNLRDHQPEALVVIASGPDARYEKAHRLRFRAERLTVFDSFHLYLEVKNLRGLEEIRAAVLDADPPYSLAEGCADFVEDRDGGMAILELRQVIRLHCQTPVGGLLGGQPIRRCASPDRQDKHYNNIKSIINQYYWIDLM